MLSYSTWYSHGRTHFEREGKVEEVLHGLHRVGGVEQQAKQVEALPLGADLSQHLQESVEPLVRGLVLLVTRTGQGLRLGQLLLGYLGLGAALYWFACLGLAQQRPGHREAEGRPVEELAERAAQSAPVELLAALRGEEVVSSRHDEVEVQSRGEARQSRGLRLDHLGQVLQPRHVQGELSRVVDMVHEVVQASLGHVELLGQRVHHLRHVGLQIVHHILDLSAKKAALLNALLLFLLRIIVHPLSQSLLYIV
eukprot:scaffold3296_cov159-Ochromonas_danica.AAC.2